MESRSQQIRLAVDGSGLTRPWAGVGNYTSNLLPAMVRERPGSALAVYGPANGFIDEPGVTVRALPSAPLAGRHLLWPLLLRQGRADAYLGCAGQLPLGGVGSPAVVTAHDLAIYRHPEWFPRGQWLSVKVVVPRSMRQADTVIAVSENTANDLTELLGIPRGKIQVVPLGVDLRQFRPLPRDTLRDRKWRRGLPDRFILFVSTLEPRKNFLTLLEAWERLKPRPELFVVGGWGWNIKGIEARIRRASRGLRMVGPVKPKDLPSYYNLATCLAHPAWYEGFGLPPLEAMACGTPVVVSNTSSLPEVVGPAGILVDPGDVEGWTAALQRVLEDENLQAQLGQEGLDRAASLTWERTARGTWLAIDSII
jgi:glycosyltransferase involved in cell wall biosynthesis